MAGLSAFQYAFNEKALSPMDSGEWDEYKTALFRYALDEALYHNTIYRAINAFSETYKHRYSLYKHIRGVYNPVYRQNELIKSKVYGGAMDWEALETGALVVVDADDPLKQALIQALKWSNFGVNKGLYVHQCALLGDVALKVVDDRAREKVRIEVLHPARIKDVTLDDVGNVKQVTIEYEREWLNPATNQLENVIYTEIIDDKLFKFFKDGEPFGWYTDADGNPLPEYENEYGFAPLVWGRFKDIGKKRGANAFHAEIHKINEINDAASLLNDSVRKAIDPFWYLAGTTASTSLKAEGRLADGTSTTDPSAQRDKVKTLHGPEGSQPYPMIFPVDIANAGKNIQDMLMELERDMPELALHRLRESGGDKPGIAIRNMYSDATGRLSEAASNMDDALIRALQMCVSIGGYRGYQNFNGFTLDSFQRGDLDFYIKERSFFEDGFTRQDRVTNLKSLPDKPEAARAVLEEMEYPPDKIEALVAEIAMSAEQKQMQNAAQNGQGGIDVQPNPRPALPAGQGQPQGAGDVMADVEDILSRLGVAAA